MRSTVQQVDAIKRAAAEIYGDAAQVWSFGSRVDDEKRGGDIRAECEIFGFLFTDDLEILRQQ